MMKLEDILARLGERAPKPDNRWEPGEWISPEDRRRAQYAEDFRRRAYELGFAGNVSDSISAEDSAEALKSAEWVYIDPFGARHWWDFLADDERNDELERRKPK